LIELGEFSYEKKLLNFLNDARPEVRATTVEQLGDFGNKYLFWLVRMFLNDKDVLVRVRAIEQLGKNRFNPALSHIKTASKDNNPLVRQAACVALGRIGNEESAVLLNLRLSDPDIYVRAAAKAALSSLTGRDFSKKKKPKVAVKNDKFLKLLWEDVKSPNPAARTSSYIALANLQQTKIIPLVLKELVSADSPALIKREGARALMILKPYLSKLVGKSLGGLKVKDSSILNSSLQIYYSIDGKNLLTIFIDALRNAEDPLHKDAPLVLKELKESMSYPFLRQALFNQDPGYQASVVYALGDLRDKDAVADIIKLCRQYGF
jgi:HEAT repeat protein